MSLKQRIEAFRQHLKTHPWKVRLLSGLPEEEGSPCSCPSCGNPQEYFVVYGADNEFQRSTPKWTGITVHFKRVEYLEPCLLSHPFTLNCPQCREEVNFQELIGILLEVK